MIEVRELTKRYAAHTAVDCLSFSVKEGRIYGLLGPNGAGKTTTMNIITGYLAPSGGSVSIDGHDIFDEPAEAKKCVGYLPEQPPLYPSMTVREYLLFAAELKQIKSAEAPSEAERAMRETGLEDVSGRLIKNLSKGYRQRVGVAQALLGDPKIIILDEPTVGLDPKQIIEIRDLIRSLGQKHTVILSSHILQEVSAVCDHILILSHGKLVAQGTPEELQALMNSGSVVTVTAGGGEEKILEALSGLGKTSVCESAEKGYSAVQLETDGSPISREKVFYALAEADCPIISMTVNTASLEDIFLELTSDEKEDEK